MDSGYLLRKEHEEFALRVQEENERQNHRLAGLAGAAPDGQAGKQTVTAMQGLLQGKGFPCGQTDGYMGAKTVRVWQRYINSRL